MKTPSCPPFVDNWSYIKTELQWLDRLLLLAVGKSRRERRELDKVTKSERDRVTKHWWKGLISLDGPPLHEDGRPTSAPQSQKRKTSKSDPLPSNRSSQSGKETVRARSEGNGGKEVGGYQQQIEARIQASRACGVLLGLPDLRDRLQLTLFEKKLILLGLAPEVNRRYARLYRYLQEDESQDLPQVDLALKLLCRNDQEWSVARRRLVENSPLIQTGLISLVASGNQPLLTHRVKLSEALVNYLLANPSPEGALDQLLSVYGGNRQRNDGISYGAQQFVPPSCSTAPRGIILSPASVAIEVIEEADPASTAGRGKSSDPWKPLIVSRSLKREFQHLSQRLQLLALESSSFPGFTPGTFVLLTGASGTGKTTAVRAMARAAQTNLQRIDLALVDALTLEAQMEQWLQKWQHQAPTVLLFQSAELVFGAQSQVSSELIEQLLVQRRQHPCLTVLSTSLQARISTQWQRQCDRILQLPLPDITARQRLWKQALSSELLAGLSLDSRVSFEKLAQQGKLTGAEIQAIARDAVLYAKTDGKVKLTLAYLQRAWRQRQACRP